MSQNTPSGWTFMHSISQEATPLTPLGSSSFFPSYPAFLSNTPIYSTPATPTPNPNKRKGKENNHSAVKKSKKDSHILSSGQKLRLFYGFLKHELNWSYGELLYHTSIPFSGDTATATPICEVNLPNTSIRHEASREQMTAMMQHFFNGKGKHTPAKIIENWYKHSYGRLERESELMFSLSTPYVDIGPVRPALSSFAAQIVSKKLLDEAEKAVDPKGGHHVSLMGKEKNVSNIAWTDVGAATMQRTQDLIQAMQPLTWEIILKLCSRNPRTQNGVQVIRQKRPANIVSLVRLTHLVNQYLTKVKYH